MTIYTVGHSTREYADFEVLLKYYKITLLADVRSVPQSRYTPQFNEDILNGNLSKVSIDYKHLGKLGGLRHTTKDSINLGWRNVSFRGYADYMQTVEFETGLGELLDLASTNTVALMCAEAVPWRCHRSLIGDALLVQGQKVIDIFDIKKSQDETLTSFAKVSGNRLTYPALD